MIKKIISPKQKKNNQKMLLSQNTNADGLLFEIVFDFIINKSKFIYCDGLGGLWVTVTNDDITTKGALLPIDNDLNCLLCFIIVTTRSIVVSYFSNTAVDVSTKST